MAYESPNPGTDLAFLLMPPFEVAEESPVTHHYCVPFIKQAVSSLVTPALIIPGKMDRAREKPSIRGCQAPLRKARESKWGQMSPGRLEFELDQNIMARWCLCHMMEIPTLKRRMAVVGTSLENVCIRCLCQTARDPIWERKCKHPVLRKTQRKHLSILLRRDRVWNTDSITLMLHAGTPLNTTSLLNVSQGNSKGDRVPVWPCAAGKIESNPSLF